MAISAAARAGGELMDTEEPLSLAADILATLVRVHEDLSTRAAAPQSDQQYPHHEIGLHAHMHRPPDHLAGEEVEDGGPIGLCRTPEPVVWFPTFWTA